MTQVTVRRVEEQWVAKAKAIAAERGVSMNTVLVDALAKGLGMDGKPRRNGLEKFAADSPDDFGRDWEESMEFFNTIDPELWK
jgi:hypothetical protein